MGVEQIVYTLNSSHHFFFFFFNVKDCFEMLKSKAVFFFFFLFFLVELFTCKDQKSTQVEAQCEKAEHCKNQLTWNRRQGSLQIIEKMSSHFFLRLNCLIFSELPETFPSNLKNSFLSAYSWFLFPHNHGSHMAWLPDTSSDQLTPICQINHLLQTCQSLV